MGERRVTRLAKIRRIRQLHNPSNHYAVAPEDALKEKSQEQGIEIRMIVIIAMIILTASAIPKRMSDAIALF